MLSHRVAALRPSPIREILGVVDRPGMVSFAGGLPATESLPHPTVDVDPAALHRHFDGHATWRTPDGGLFFWLRLDRRVDTRTLLADAIAANVAFMPGEEFYAGTPGSAPSASTSATPTRPRPSAA